MPKNKKGEALKTWIELDENALKENIRTFQALIPRRTKLFAVVKSNAYGHGITAIPKLAVKHGVDGFCVDSVQEGRRLREEGIESPILVLGPTFPDLFPHAEKRDLTVTISTIDGLKALAKIKARPAFHVKIETGMHRQGISPSEVPRAARFIRQNDLLLKGLYTHYASAKDLNYTTYTEKQLAAFREAASIFGKYGFRGLALHTAATAGTLIGRRHHLDLVRVGIGLYGLWPSKELAMQLPELALKPVLSWRATISEVKDVEEGAYIGYDLTYRAPRKTRIAILPIGYWHGLSRGFSNGGTVLVAGRRVPIVGRVSMDMTMIDVGKFLCRPGDVATLIGRDGKEKLTAGEMAEKTGTIHYELVTRINPLIEKIRLSKTNATT